MSNEPEEPIDLGRSRQKTLGNILARISAEVMPPPIEPANEGANLASIESPQIDVIKLPDSWPDDIVFPFTPMECYYLLRGYGVKPRQVITPSILQLLPKISETADLGYHKLK